MPSIAATLRNAILGAGALLLAAGAAASADAADMPAPPPFEKAEPALSGTDFLSDAALLQLLRLRFGARIEDEVRDAMHAAAQALDDDGHPSAKAIAALDRDLTAELFYYTVYLRYLILAEGAVWPDDRPARTYRNDALSALDAVANDLFAGDTLSLDIAALLKRLEQVNAWTEGQSEPEHDWFDPRVRQSLVDDALKAASGTAKT